MNETEANTTNMTPFGVGSDGCIYHWAEFRGRRRAKRAILVGHGGGHRNGNPGPSGICTDLQSNGLDAYAFEYPMTVKKLVGQRNSGQVPEQAVAMDMAISKLFSLGYAEVGAVGCSAGGALALSNAHRLYAMVLLSPDTKYDVGSQNPDFDEALDLYLGPHDRAVYSPVNIMRQMRPFTRIYTSFYEYDSMPWIELEALRQCVIELLIPYSERILPGVGHATDGWPQVKNEAINFLKI